MVAIKLDSVVMLLKSNSAAGILMQLSKEGNLGVNVNEITYMNHETQIFNNDFT
jgi:hypothetical protein